MLAEIVRRFTLQTAQVWNLKDLQATLDRCFLKWWYPQIIHFNRAFHYFHHSFWGTPILGNRQTRTGCTFPGPPRPWNANLRSADMLDLWIHQFANLGKNTRRGLKKTTRGPGNPKLTTDSSPLESYRLPQKESSWALSTIFQGRTVKLRGCYSPSSPHPHASKWRMVQKFCKSQVHPGSPVTGNWTPPTHRNLRQWFQNE